MESGRGTAFSHNYYAAFSRLTVEQTTDAVLMTAAEVWFLRAEAALRGGPARARRTVIGEV